MRVLLSLVFCCLLCSCKQSPRYSQVAISQEEEVAVKALVQGIFDDVWGGLDSTKILNYHTEDFVILENGEVWTNGDIKDYVRSALARKSNPTRLNKMEYISMDKYGESINMAYHNYATFMNADTIAGRGQWLESATAIKTNQGWRLKTMHSTWVPQRK